MVVQGDLAWATRIASNIGRGFGYLLIAGGIAMLIFQGSFSGAWLAFLGWFLLQAATAEARYVATQQALDGLRVRDLTVWHPITVDADLTLGQFVDEVTGSRRRRGDRRLAELSRSDVNRGLVVENEHLAGLLSITDLARALEVRRPSRATLSR